MVAFAQYVERELVKEIESEEGHMASLNRSRVTSSPSASQLEKENDTR